MHAGDREPIDLTADQANAATAPAGTQLRRSADDYRAAVRGRVDQRRRHVRRRAALTVVAWVLILLLSASLTLGALWWFSPTTNPITGLREHRGSGLLRVIDNIRSPEQSLLASFAGQREVSVLLVGLDHVPPTRRDPGHIRRSDSVILTRANFDTHQVRMASIPRDGWVEHWQDGQTHGHSNIANTYSYGQQEVMRASNVAPESPEAHRGGIQRLEETVEQLLGFPVDYYVVIEFDGLVKLVDTLCPNGLMVDVDRRMKYTDRAGGLFIDLQKGPQLLNGEQVVQYARFRKERLGDYARMPRQQQVIKLILEELKKPENVTKLPEVVAIMQESVRTNLSTDQLLALAQHMDDTFPKEGMQSITVESVWNREPGHRFELPGGHGLQGQAFFPEHLDKARAFLGDLNPPPVPEITAEGEGATGSDWADDPQPLTAEGEKTRGPQ